MFYGNHNGSADLFLTSIYKATIIVHLLFASLSPATLQRKYGRLN